MKTKFTKEDPCIAHCSEDKSETQSVSAHDEETGILAEKRCRLINMRPIVRLAGKLHDLGKYGDLFQEYIQQEEDVPIKRGEVNHATAGGLVMEELVPQSPLSEIIQIAIYSHHGIYDAIDIGKAEYLIEKRHSEEYQKKEKIELELVKQRFYQYVDKDKLDQTCCDAKESFRKLWTEIKDFLGKDREHLYGSGDFYFGMHERLLMSLLIDADRSNTAEFMDCVSGKEAVKSELDDWSWQECLDHLENRIAEFKVKSPIDQYRKEISEICFHVAEIKYGLYRLTLPTGSGKTLSGLRFALKHAKEMHKQRIIYVAPFNSILEQNAEEIRNAVGRKDLVLEHHCNVIHETPDEQERYDRLTENWSSPIVATTAVQFLNTLFSSKSGSIRRMHSLCDSIVIFDEIQALPVNVISLFNLAVNYLTTFCNTTVVLCSATQPVFDKLPKNRLLPPREIVKNYVHYDKLFRRVKLHDKTGLKPGGLSIEDAGEFILQHYPEEKQMLIVVNTKTCARKLYKYLKTKIDSNCALFHLSTNMCVLNRRDVLEQMKKLLSEEDNPKTVICISTQLIEAGVDLSFRCVIRSLAGLDNIIQAAGRCNRHGKMRKGNEEIKGNVYIVKMAREAENISNLRDVKIGQAVMEEILEILENRPEQIDGDLLSDKSKEQYYLKYFQKQLDQVDFGVEVQGASTTLVDLLSNNPLAKGQYRIKNNGKKIPYKFKMNQAFKTAGDLFEVITENGQVNVVVEYNDNITKLIQELENPYTLYSRQKEILRELQLATVGINEQLKTKLGRAVAPVCNGLIYRLSPDYYSMEIGVCEEPQGMKLLNM